jgi:hypothetical protein
MIVRFFLWLVWTFKCIRRSCNTIFGTYCDPLISFKSHFLNNYFQNFKGPLCPQVCQKYLDPNSFETFILLAYSQSFDLLYSDLELR